MRGGRSFDRAFFLRDAGMVARELLGARLVRRLGRATVVARIVETEAYLGERDRASHAFALRRTARNESMYGAGGHAYVYFVYGMHHCLNVVTREAEVPEAVLVRAAEVISGEECVRRLREAGPSLASASLLGGPGRLCRGLAIDRALDGTDLLQERELWLEAGDEIGDAAVVRGPRVGVDYAGEATSWPLRFAVADSPAVSMPRPWAARRPARGVSASRSGRARRARASRG